MNMITVLLGTTGILLVVVLGISIADMSKGATPEKIAELEQQLLALEAEEAELRNRKAQQLAATNPLPATPAPAMPVTPAPAQPSLSDAAFELEALKEELAERDRQIAELASENEAAEKQAEIATAEAEMFNERNIERREKERARARFIKDAILMARVTEWSDENGFAVIEIMRPDLVDVNTELGIRRNSGIVGRLKVSQMYEAGKAIADPVTGTFPGGLDVKAGDELIVPD